MSEYRDPLAKQKFLQGNRQRWCSIFLILGAGVFLGNLYFTHIDPTPYMNFLLAIGSLFIIGGTVDSFVKGKAKEHIQVTEMKEETKRQEKKSEDKPEETVVAEYSDKFSTDPSYAPVQWAEEQES